MTAPALPRLHALDWDSKFFGFAVARLDGITDPPTQLPGVSALLAGSGVTLAYWDWPSDDPAGHATAAETGGDFINTRAELHLANVTGSPVPLDRIVTEPKPAERTALAALALASGWSSRFALDPRFPDPLFRRMYLAWIENSLSGEIADAVIVARRQATIDGMITVSARDGHGRIGLFGVAEHARGRGVGKQLLADTLGWFATKGCTTASVVTQGENHAALAVYRALGFTLDDLRHVFHFWKPLS